MAKETIFSKIVAGDIPCDKIYEDELILAFKDINPEAEVHILVIPKSNHLEKIADLQLKDEKLISHMMLKITEIAKIAGINEEGYRVVTNSGPNSGQEVDHLHFHILGGEKLNNIN
jgi:histidine triad (HIT) family protein